MTVRVHLRPGVPDPSACWDAAHTLGLRLQEALGVAEVALTVTTNRTRLVSWRRSGARVEVAVQHALVAVPADVVAVVQHRDAAALARLRAVPRTARAPHARAAGRAHDLGRIRPDEDARVRRLAPRFEPASVPVGWGRWPTRPPRRMLRLGSHGGSPPVIRVHPVLDHPSVPAWFVGFIVFHELLHAAFPPQQRGARRVVHTPDFRAAERTHPRYADALVWEDGHVAELIRRVRATISP